MKGIFTKELKEIEQLIIRGKYNHALDKIDSLSDNEEITKEEKIQCKIFKARIYLRIFPYSKAIKYAEGAYEESKTIENKTLMFDSVNILLKACFYAGKYELKEKKAELANEIMESFENKDSEEYLRRKAVLPLFRGDNFITTFASMKESISISEKIGDLILMADSYFNISSKNLWSGNLVEALEYAQKSLDICNRVNYHYGTIISLFEKGIIYLHKGELDLAHDYLQKTYHMVKDNLNPYFKGGIFMDLGLIYWLKRDLKTSLEYYRKSVLFLKQANVVSTRHYPWLLIRMNNVLIEMGRVDEAWQNLKIIKQLYLSKNRYIFKKIFFLAKAILLKTTSHPKNTKEAIILLEEFADDDIAIMELYGLVIFHLCDLYLKEISKSEDLETYEKLKHRIKKLSKMAEQQQSYILLTESLLIQSKLDLIEFNVSEGQILLEEAQKIAEEKGITYLAKVISNEYDILLTQLSTWQEMSSYFPSLEERFELSHLEDLLTKIIKNNAIYINIQDENELPYFFLIINKDRNVVFSEAFGDFSLDEDLLQGILTCINENIYSQSLGSDKIMRIMYQNFTIAINKQENILLIYSFVGQSYGAIQKLRSFRNKFSFLLNEWNNYFKKFKTSKELTLNERVVISKFLETVFVTE